MAKKSLPFPGAVPFGNVPPTGPFGLPTTAPPKKRKAAVKRKGAPKGKKKDKDKA